jgi:hypothetical protein
MNNKTIKIKKKRKENKSWRAEHPEWSIEKPWEGTSKEK